ncbi:MAG: hypothetical protein U1E76_06025 [Planctomycetota bacterium]
MDALYPSAQRWLRSALVLAALAAGEGGLLANDVTRRVSLDSTGSEVKGDSSSPSISADGRVVAFLSDAADLVGGDTNHSPDVFVRDLVTGLTTRASVDSNGNQGDSYCADPVISSDGHVVVFASLATNLVAGDTNNEWDVFVRDLDQGTTERVSVAADLTEANGNSYVPVVSQDGRYVAFLSYATNLVPGDANDVADIFVKDRLTGAITLVSKSSTGDLANGSSRLAAISADGRYVAFASDATNLVPGDSNGASDIFLHDTRFAITIRVSVGAGGVQGNGDSFAPSISADARYVAFASQANDLVANDTNGLTDVFVADLWTSAMQLVSISSSGAQGDGSSDAGAISADARYVAFRSRADNLAPGDGNGFLRDVFVRDRLLASTEMASVTDQGAGGNDESPEAAVSGDGRLVVFATQASNLVPGDRNGASDIYLHGLELTLEEQPPVVREGDLISFTSYFGAPQNAATLWAVQVDQVPFWMMIFAGVFQADERFVLAGALPPGLGSADIVFRVYAAGPTAFLLASNDVTVSFR